MNIQCSAGMYSRVAQTKHLQLSISEIPSGHLKKKKKSGTETNNNLHFHFKYSTRCQLQITFKTLSQFSVVNKTITKILTKSHKTQLWCNHTPYIAQSLTFLCFMRSLPGGRSGILLLLFSDTGHRSSLICGHSGVRCDCHQDLHSHGETRYLCEGVGQRAGRCSQGKQVGNAVQHSTREENQEVKACHSQ